MRVRDRFTPFIGSWRNSTKFDNSFSLFRFFARGNENGQREKAGHKWWNANITRVNERSAFKPLAVLESQWGGFVLN